MELLVTIIHYTLRNFAVPITGTLANPLITTASTREVFHSSLSKHQKTSGDDNNERHAYARRRAQKCPTS